MDINVFVKFSIGLFCVGFVVGVVSNKTYSEIKRLTKENEELKGGY